MRRGLHQQGLSVPRAALGRRSVCWGAGLCIARVRSLSGTRREAGGEGFSSPGPRRALPAGLLRRELQVGPPVSQRAPMAEAPSSPLHALYCCSLSGQKYNVLHLRLERDWVEHCKEMAQPYKDSCLNNTYTGGQGGAGLGRRAGACDAVPVRMNGSRGRGGRWQGCRCSSVPGKPWAGHTRGRCGAVAWG